MRSIHIVPRIVTEASGPGYSAMALCRALRATGSKVDLAIVEPAPDRTIPDFTRVFRNTGGPYRLGRSRDLYRWLTRAVQSGDIDLVHNHSLWMMPNVYSGWATRGSAVPLMVSPRGTLSQWALSRSRRLKQVFWKLLQLPAIRHAACFHATAESEYEDIRRAGFRQPVCIIPNGIEIPPVPEQANKVTETRRLLYLGRIHPVKGLDTLLHAWSAVEGSFPDWTLEIIGPSNVGYLEKMQSLASDLKLSRVAFRGPIFDRDKQQAYQDAELYVLPTYSENFGMTVAEALAAGTPAIVTKGAPWAGLESHGAGWWIEIGIEPLVSCLQEALACSQEKLVTKGAAGRQWMQQEFSWDRLGKMMLDTYRWLRNGGSRPEWINLV